MNTFKLYAEVSI